MARRKLNHLEGLDAAMVSSDPASRRNIPFEAKADSQANPERTRGRGAGICESHFSVEGWIGQGKKVGAHIVDTGSDPARQQRRSNRWDI